MQHVAKRKKDAHAETATRGLAAAVVSALDACCAPLGLMQATADEFFARTRTRRLNLRGLDAGVIEEKVSERARARQAKDFARSDAIRLELARMGVELQDAPGGAGTVWKLNA